MKNSLVNMFRMLKGIAFSGYHHTETDSQHIKDFVKSFLNPGKHSYAVSKGGHLNTLNPKYCVFFSPISQFKGVNFAHPEKFTLKRLISIGKGIKKGLITYGFRVETAFFIGFPHIFSHIYLDII